MQKHVLVQSPRSIPGLPLSGKFCNVSRIEKKKMAGIVLKKEDIFTAIAVSQM